MSWSTYIYLYVKCTSFLVNLLPKRLKHATDVLEKASAEIDGIISTAQGKCINRTVWYIDRWLVYSVPITEDTIIAWSDKEKSALSQNEAEISMLRFVVRAATVWVNSMWILYPQVMGSVTKCFKESSSLFTKGSFFCCRKPNTQVSFIMSCNYTSNHLDY